VTELRRMTEADVPAANELKNHTFADLERRLGEEPTPVPDDPSPQYVRLRRLVHTDPGGAWVAERDGELVGCAMALVREGVWGLSLLVVRPDAQSGGLGRALLRRVYEHGGAAVTGRIVLSSSDPRALRSYARLGLTAHPCLSAKGVPNGVAEPPDVRPGTLADLPLTEEIDRRVRRAAHGDDIAALLESGHALLVAPGRGYAVTTPTEVRLLAASDEAAARDLLLGVLARAGRVAISVDWLSAQQDWAVRTCVEAGLELSGHGAVFLGGDVGPFRPYLPSGAYL
jgi:GNAT superfamily N-acetyltransferase